MCMGSLEYVAFSLFWPCNHMQTAFRSCIDREKWDFVSKHPSLCFYLLWLMSRCVPCFVFIGHFCSIALWYCCFQHCYLDFFFFYKHSISIVTLLLCKRGIQVHFVHCIDKHKLIVHLFSLFGRPFVTYGSFLIVNIFLMSTSPN